MDSMAIANLVVSGLVIPIMLPTVGWAFRANRELGCIKSELKAIKEKLSGNGHPLPQTCFEHTGQLDDLRRRVKALEK